jgi:DNA modification methylase
MEVRSIPIKDIKPYANNPRNNKDAVEKVAESIKEFGWKQPIVIDKNGVIIAGHTRYKAAQKLGHTSVPVVCADDLTEEQVKAYRLADNKTAGFSTWDMDLLEVELEGLQAISFDMARFGFEEAVLEPEEIEEDDFEADKAVEEITTPISKKGDIWLLGRHRLRCGDSTSQADVDCLMDGQKARLIVTDAPYNVNFNNNGNSNHPSWKKRDGIMNDNMSTEDFREFLKKAFTCASKAVEPGAVIFAFMSAQEWPTIDGVMREIGWHWSSSIIWVKDSMVLGRKDFQPRYESIWYGWQEGTPRLYPLKEDRTQTDVWEFDKPKRNPLHPTQKPLSVISKAIKLSSRANDIVLDMFGGSASTLIAADQLGRVAYLQELDERYADVGARRYVEYKGSADGVFLLREGEKIAYADAVSSI